jgi:hypothetical protein
MKKSDNIAGVKIYEIKNSYVIYFEEIHNCFYYVDEIGEILNEVGSKGNYFCRPAGATHIIEMICNKDKNLTKDSYYLGRSIVEARNELIRRLNEDVKNPTVSKTDSFIKAVTRLHNHIKP